MSTNDSVRWSLEVVVVPVSDDTRIIQLTPPGSGCSIVIGSGVVPDMDAGSLEGLQLVVADIEAADRS